MAALTIATMAALSLVVAWLLLFGGIAAHAGHLRRIYRHHFAESRRERLFLASLSFFLTFGAVRLITHSIRAGVGPFHDISAGGRHIHHLVWGILLLLIVGYLWLAEIGTGARGYSVWAGRMTALLYGMAAALTLDEFALWLNLADVYWSPEGRASVRAAFFFGSLLSIGIWGGPFLHALARHAFRRGERT